MRKPVKDNEGWFRDSSGTFDMSSKSKYEKYMLSYNAELEKQRQQEALQNEVSQLKSDMSDIKSLLLTLVQQKQNNHDD